ncbi:MAG: flagellar hook protein FlgE [Candidatus Loosdrechtia sp.]|uniref:flagellar hook protein FlgE n=1 Tax=Candidatus Loosdrechtia sp. TaxID=3101272 RepID=UPI003A6B7ED7|nr:MAG: flagellar hook-basal body complex protein [Candidatus Jettenia sp. AMX2]
MITSLASGVSGLKTSQMALNVIGDNLANLNTSGFKVSRVNFANELMQTIRPALESSGVVGGTNPIQIGTGTRVSSIIKNFTQGNLISTGRLFDLAIQGSGFFVLKGEFEDYYTRAGSFGLDKSNNIIDLGTGLRAKGISGNAINVPVGSTVEGRATTTASISGNLNAEFSTGAVNHVTKSISPYTVDGVPATTAALLNDLDQTTASYIAGDKISVIGSEHNGKTVNKSFVYGTDGTTLGDLIDFISNNFGTATASLDANGNLLLTSDPPGNSNLTLSISDDSGNTGRAAHPTYVADVIGSGDVYVTSLTVYDTLGTSYLITLYFEKTGNNQFDLTPTMEAEFGSVTDSISSINFNTNGSFASVDGTPTITITYPNNSMQTITLNFGTANTFDGLTQFGGTSSAASVYQDGYEEGYFSSVAVNQNGKVVSLFTNGQTREVGQIQLAIFSNPEGLSAVGNNLFSKTLASGDAVFVTALSGGVGSIISGALESSNVDMAEEFTKLIVSQRAFQANARTITTTDEILRELVNLSR